MRVLSYNIHGCIGRDKREEPERILKLIQGVGADIVGLQEVHSADAQDRDFLRQLEQLPYSAILYGKTMRKPSADYGNVLLLRDHPRSVERIELPYKNGEPRGAIIADLVEKGQALRVVLTHLDSRFFERKRQARALLDYAFPGGEGRCLFLGDFNEWLPCRPYFRHLESRFHAISTEKTFPVKPALFALDRIGVRGSFRVCRFESDRSELAGVASDHRPLICEIDWVDRGMEKPSPTDGTQEVR